MNDSKTHRRQYLQTFIIRDSFHSTFFLNCFLKITGTSVIQANTTSSNIEVHENASFELVMVLSVLPAWMARNDGGATPKKINELCQNYEGTHY